MSRAITRRNVLPPPLWKIFRDELKGSPKPSDSVAYLRSKLIFSNARDTLFSLKGHAFMLKLFSHFFPEEIAKHDGRSAFKADDRKEMLRDFYTLVDRKLFCINLDWLIDVMMEEDDSHDILSYEIPISYVHNKDWWEGFRYGVDDLHVFERCILSALGYLDGDSIKSPPYESETRAVVDMEKLARLCGDKKPLSYVPDAVRIVNHSADNFFIDELEQSFDDGMSMPPWSIEDVEWFAAQHKEADEIWSRVKELEKWLKADEVRRAAALMAGATDGLSDSQKAELKRRLRPRRQSRYEQVFNLVRECVMVENKIRARV
jgi:hypothetical protein